MVHVVCVLCNRARIRAGLLEVYQVLGAGVGATLNLLEVCKLAGQQCRAQASGQRAVCSAEPEEAMRKVNDRYPE